MKLGLASGTVEGSFRGRTPTFRDLQEMVLLAEQIGLDSFWLADHLLYRFSEQDERGAWEAFTLLGALAAVTTRISLGPSVAAIPFRNPALLAKMADTLDEISGGRFILGLGAGWHQPEFDAFGYPFDHRASRFEEALEIIAPLLRRGHVDFQGQYYQAHNAVLRPRGPSRAGPPIWIGAKGPRMLRLAAWYGDAWNTVWHLSAAKVQDACLGFKKACVEVGRDPAAVQLTAGTMVKLLRPGEEAWLDDGISGTPQEIADRLAEFAHVGVQHLMIMIDPPDLVGLERLARVIELLP
ncbi:MAG: LLM class flavin-dependent oxidoreductase [Anaerolineae bacterium]